MLLLCSALLLSPAHTILPVPSDTHTHRTIAPLCSPLIHPLFAINLPQGRQAGTSTVFCFAIKFDWCKRGSQSLAHSHTYKCINTDMRLLHASVSLALTYVNNKCFQTPLLVYVFVCVCVNNFVIVVVKFALTESVACH